MMTTLPPLYEKVKTMLPPGKYNYVSPAAVIAVCLQESGGVPTFNSSDALFHQNLQAAASVTTLPPTMILDYVKIQEGPLAGQIAKFRFEPGYWVWAGSQGLPSINLRFLCSCSFGVGQQMMRWVLPQNKDRWEGFVENFKGSLNTQLTYVIETLERLLGETEGDLFKAYKAYNSGTATSVDIQVMRRATRVVELRDKVQEQLQG